MRKVCIVWRQTGDWKYPLRLAYIFSTERKASTWVAKQKDSENYITEPYELK